MRAHALAVLLAAAVASPPAVAEPSSDAAAACQRNLETARWMLAYDQAAWQSTDLLLKEKPEALKQVTPVWLCFRQQGAWCAVFGSNTPKGYHVAFCYQEGPGGRYHKAAPPAFPDLDRFARALDLTLPPFLEMTRRYTVRFNYYVRAEGDRIAVYYLPAEQPDGKLAYGVYRTCWTNAAGTKLLAETAHGDQLAGIIPGKQRILTLEMADLTVPMPQAIFIMLAYRDQFGRILTHCRDGYYGISADADGKMTCELEPAPALP